MMRLKNFALLCFALSGSFQALATTQVVDRLVVKNDTVHMYGSPLAAWQDSEENRGKLHFEMRSMNCIRGYQATWLLEDGKLFLTDLTAYPRQQDELPVDLKTVFGDRYADGRVFVDWADGEYRASSGKYVPYGTGLHAAEYDCFMKFEGGFLKSDQMYRNWEKLPGRLTSWDQDIREQLAAIFTENIRWKRLEGERMAPYIDGRLRVDENGFATLHASSPDKCIAELNRILKKTRWNVLTVKGEPRSLHAMMFLKVDLQTRTVRPAEF